MIDEADSLTSGERRVGAVIAAYLEALDRGEVPDRGAFLRDHAACAGELASFFADQDQLCGLVPRAGDETSSLTSDVPPPATTIARRVGDYELLEEIGRGGMGVVFRARQVSLGRLVAVKVILAAGIASAEDLRRFQREAQTVARLEHPHIIPIYEAGAHQGHPYFSMPLREGESLAARATQPADDPRAAAEIVVAIAGAIHHPPAWRVAPRSQAGQHSARRARPAAGRRFRAGQADGGRAGRHPEPGRRGNAGLHGARAGAGRQGADTRD